MRVLFLCTRNAIRSPMAEALAREAFPAHTFASAGVDPMDVDGFAIAAMAEVGVDLMRHEAQDLADMGAFDLIIALSHQAASAAADRVDQPVERWTIADPSLTEGNRDQRLAAYREVRETIATNIKARFAS